MAIGICAARVMINFMDELGFKRSKPIPVFEDNEAACKLATEHLNTSRSKHIPHRHHLVKEQVMKELNFKAHWCSSGWQLADMFTPNRLTRQKSDMLNCGQNLASARAHARTVISDRF